ncbi:MAG: hypothetical protein JW841_03365 [Deltaproteobacteria bacterium]|nr:hypothetical protein [Deltaproteobacteria bacterium]
MANLFELPPFLLIIPIIAIAIGWQIIGTLAILPIIPRVLSSGWRLLLAWFCWLPLSGAIVLALVLAGFASRNVLLVGTFIIFLIALLSWRLSNTKPTILAAYKSFKNWKSQAKKYELWLWRGGVALQAIIWGYVAHPQKMFDQLGYHLVVGHLVVRDGEPFSGVLDPHIHLAGILEYAFAWHYSWFDSRMFINGVAQIAVLAITVPVIIWCSLRLGRASLGFLGLLFILLPGVLPESVILRMVKPDGVILTGVIVLLTLLIDSPVGFMAAGIGVGGMMLGCKFTFAHATLGLFLAIIIAKPPIGRLRPWLPLIIVGLLCFALPLYKNYLLFENPVYPALIAKFPSQITGQWTRNYWNHQAYVGRSALTGWLGPFILTRRAASLYGCLFVAAFFIFLNWRKRQNKLVLESRWRQALIITVAFIIGTWLFWPLFFSGKVTARFVSGFFGGVFVLWLLLQRLIADSQRKYFFIACTCIGLLASHFDRILPNLILWNLHSTKEAYAMQWPRLKSAIVVNASINNKSDVILTDHSNKLYFDGRVLYEEPLGLAQRAMVAEITQNPVDAAGRFKLAAIVVSANRSMSPRMQYIWDTLEPNGKIIDAGNDRVLLSKHYFQP